MENRVRFSMSSLLVATTLTAVWCGLFVIRRRIQDGLIGDSVMDRSEVMIWAFYQAVVISLPAVIVGVLSQRPRLGALCGIASGTAAALIQLAPLFGL